MKKRNLKHNILNSEKETETEIELFEMKGSKQEQDGFTQEVPSPSLFPEKRSGIQTKSGKWKRPA